MFILKDIMVIYKTTNLVNGKLLKLGIKKYIKDNFVKEIIEECSSMDVFRELKLNCRSACRGLTKTAGGFK